MVILPVFSEFMLAWCDDLSQTINSPMIYLAAKKTVIVINAMETGRSEVCLLAQM